MASYYGHAQLAEDRYRLTVTINDTKLSELNVTGATAGQAIAVPLKALKVGGTNRVRFEMEGRGRFGYAVTLQGFTRDFSGRAETGQSRRAACRGECTTRLRRSSMARCCRSASASPSILRRSRTSPARSRWAARPTSCSRRTAISPRALRSGSATS